MTASPHAGRTPDPALPFFAYGVFKPGEIAFFQIKAFVAGALPATTRGELLLRDGVPVLDHENSDHDADGYEITFRRGTGADAYRAIAAMEPDTQYRWLRRDGLNILAGRSPRKGARPLYEEPWSSWRDPMFESALDVVGEAERGRFDWTDFRPFYRLQGAYLLLWASIERYVSLRYGLGRNDAVMARVMRLAQEPAFAAALSPVEALSRRRIQRADDPGDGVGYDANDPERALRYLYQVRSNVTHRGKEASLDWDVLYASTSELHRIFRGVLSAAEREAQWCPPESDTATTS